MAQLIYDNKTVDLDDEGFLRKSDEWNEQVARMLADREGIADLSRSKLAILAFLRDYYRKFSSFPILKYVCKNIHASSPSCVTDEFVDPIKAWKIAGLPKPPQVFFTSFDGKHFFANPFY